MMHKMELLRVKDVHMRGNAFVAATFRVASSQPSTKASMRRTLPAEKVVGQKAYQIAFKLKRYR